MVITPSGSLQGLARLFMERGFVLIELLDGELKRPREWKEGLIHLFELLQTFRSGGLALVHGKDLTPDK